MQAALLSLAAVGSVAAQSITLFPANPAVVAAIDPSDPEYTACSAANELLGYCVTALGGQSALQTADPDELVSCACCIDGTAISPAYSICSTYLADEEPTLTSEADAFGTLYAVCDMSARCSASGAGNTRATQTSTEIEVTSTSTSESRSGFGSGDSDSSTGTITTGPAAQTYASACTDMLDIFVSCTNKIDDFTELPFREQASCFCCQTDFGGDVTFTDALGDYASTCSKWAITGEPDTAYGVAKTYATFCSRFSDVCTAGTTITTGDTTITSGSVGILETSSAGGNGGSSVQTVTVNAQPTTTSSEDLAPTVGVAVGAVVGAIGLFAIVL